MQTLNDLLYNFAIFIKRYPVVYFSFAGLILLSMLIYLIKDRLQRIKHGVSIMANLGTPQAVDYLITFLYEDDREIIRMILA